MGVRDDGDGRGIGCASVYRALQGDALFKTSLHIGGNQ